MATGEKTAWHVPPIADMARAVVAFLGMADASAILVGLVQIVPTVTLATLGEIVRRAAAALRASAQMAQMA